jgi:hypothetical protein
MFPKDWTNLSAYAVHLFQSGTHMTEEVPEFIKLTNKMQLCGTVRTD